MVLLLLTYAADSLITAALVGITWFSVLRWREAAVSPRRTFLSLLGIFVDLDFYWWPAILPLDITFTVGNVDVARFLDLSPNMRADEFFGIGPSDFPVWVIKAFVALWTGRKVVGIHDSHAA